MPSSRFIQFALLVLLVASPALGATAQYWDTSDTTPLQAGNGTWSTSSGSSFKLWNNIGGTGSRGSWSDNNDAWFTVNGSSAITIDSGKEPTANSLNFTGTGYAISTNFLTLSGSAAIVTDQNATISSSVRGTVGLNKSGVNVLTLSGSNQFTGTLAITNGTISVNSINSTQTAAQPLGQSGTAISLGNASTAGTLEFTGSSTTINRGFTINAAGGTIRSTANTLTLGATGSTSGISGGNTVTFDGSGSFIANALITGSGTAVTKTGSGTLTLNNTHTYTGVTNIHGGTFNVAGSITGAGTVNVGDGVNTNTGTLAGSTLSSRTVNVDKGGTITAGSVGAAGSISTGAQNWAGGGKYQWDISSTSGGYDVLNVGGTLTVNATSGNKFTVAVNSIGTISGFNQAVDSTYTIANVSSISGGFDATKFALDTTGFIDDYPSAPGTWAIEGTSTEVRLKYSVPDPGSFTLLLVGASAAIRRRRRS